MSILQRVRFIKSFLAKPHFIATVSFVLTVLGFGCVTSPSASNAAANDYNIALLGDLHYDAPPVERFHDPANPGPYKRNVAMWEEEMPAMLKASGTLATNNTAFALQLGDLIDGTFRGYEAHTQMLAEATAVLEKAYPGLPVISVCGNHDYFGPAPAAFIDKARKAYNDHMLPWLARQVAPLMTNALTSTTFGFRHGPDLWIFINYNEGDATVPIVEKLLDDNPDVRYTFVALHGPVLPMDLFKYRWFYLGEEKQNALRRKIRARLAQRNAIVLAGHVHSLEYKEWRGDGGSITEMVVTSVSRNGSNKPKPAIPRVVSETPDDYGAWVKDVPKSPYNNQFDALYEEYRPGLKSRYAAWAFGHYVLRVSDSGVILDYYGRDALEPTKSFKLR